MTKSMFLIVVVEENAIKLLEPCSPQYRNEYATNHVEVNNSCVALPWTLCEMVFSWER